MNLKMISIISATNFFIVFITASLFSPTNSTIQCNHVKPMNGDSSCEAGPVALGGQCTFNCSTGYALNTTHATVQCIGSTSSHIENWNNTIPTCNSEIQCVHVVPIGGVSSCKEVNVDYERTCTIICSAGFAISTETQQTCQGTSNPGVWSATPTCTSIKCLALTRQPNGELTCNELSAVLFPSYGNVCTVTCTTVGFGLTSPGGLRCEGTTNPGVWNSTTIPTCEAIKCAHVKPANGGSTCTGSQVVVNQECTFTCNEGFVLNGETTLKCKGTSVSNKGIWNSTEPTCHSIQCLHAVPAHGSSDCTEGNIDYGTTCNISCADDYVISADIKQTCQGTSNPGQWSTSPSCTHIGCTFAIPDGGRSINCVPGIIDHGTICNIACLDGYAISAGTEQVCQATANTGVWSASPTCTRIQCTHAIPDNGSSNCGAGDVDFGTTCNINCSTGYEISNETQQVCQGTTNPGEWSASPTCTRIGCTHVVPAHGSSDCAAGNIEHGTTCSITCSIGYEISEGAKQTCKGTTNPGVWSVTPVCILNLRQIISYGALFLCIVIFIAISIVIYKIYQRKVKRGKLSVTQKSNNTLSESI